MDNFTQEQVNEMLEIAKKEWLEKELIPIQSELEEVKSKLPKTLTEEEKALQTKQQELFQKEVNLTLKEKGLDKFADFFNVEKIEDLQVKIEKFQTTLKELKLDNSYKPNDHKNTDEYSKFEKEKNTTGMIASKLSDLFK